MFPGCDLSKRSSGEIGGLGFSALPKEDHPEAEGPQLCFHQQSVVQMLTSANLLSQLQSPDEDSEMQLKALKASKWTFL